AGMAPLQGLEEAMAAFAAAARLERRWAAADALPALPPAAPIEGGRRLLDEWQSKRLLAEHGLVLPAGRLVAPTEAVAAARAFGLALVIGAGGVLVELVADSATLLLPTTEAAIGEALSGLRIARLLGGYRGRPAGDVTAAVRAIAAIAAAAEALGDRLIELDVNPLLVLPAGQGAIAVDALIVLAEQRSDA